MKHLSAIVVFLISLQVFPSGTSIGNGFAADSFLKAASLKNSKSEEKVCTDIKGARVEKIDGSDICRLKDGTIKMKDLIEAAKKNDLKK